MAKMDVRIRLGKSFHVFIACTIMIIEFELGKAIKIIFFVESHSCMVFINVCYIIYSCMILFNMS